MSYTLETVYMLYNDKSGEVVEIGPDLDGLELIEIRVRESDQKISSRITFDKKAIPYLVTALKNLALANQ